MLMHENTCVIPILVILFLNQNICLGTQKNEATAQHSFEHSTKTRGSRLPLMTHIRYVHKGKWPCPLVAMYFDGQICFSYFSRSFSDHFYQIIFNSDHRF